MWNEHDDTSTLEVATTGPNRLLRVRSHARYFTHGDTLEWSAREVRWTPKDRSIVQFVFDRLDATRFGPYSGRGSLTLDTFPNPDDNPASN